MVFEKLGAAVKHFLHGAIRQQRLKQVALQLHIDQKSVLDLADNIKRIAVFPEDQASGAVFFDELHRVRPAADADYVGRFV